MSGGAELYNQDILALIRREIARELNRSFGGSPGVYPNVVATVDRTGRLRYARGGAEIAISWSSPGTVYYVAPYPVLVADAQGDSASGTATWSYAVGGGTAFGGTSVPFRLARGDTLRVAAAGCGAWAALTLVRDLSGTVEGTA